MGGKWCSRLPPPPRPRALAFYRRPWCLSQLAGKLTKPKGRPEKTLPFEAPRGTPLCQRSLRENKQQKDPEPRAGGPAFLTATEAWEWAKRGPACEARTPGQGAAPALHCWSGTQRRRVASLGLPAAAWAGRPQAQHLQGSRVPFPSWTCGPPNHLTPEWDAGTLCPQAFCLHPAGKPRSTSAPGRREIKKEHVWGWRLKLRRSALRLFSKLWFR